MLLEILGQTEGSINFDLGQKANGMLGNVAGELVMAVIETTADGSLFFEDPAEVDELILANDPNIGNPLPDHVPSHEEGGEDDSPEDGF